MNLAMLYRGSLASCNYACDYCPFAKRVDPPEALRQDRQQLERFVDWIAHRATIAPEDRYSVLVTPWGEALVRWWYADALARLSHLPNVTKSAIQTNLSGKLDWLPSANVAKLGLWCTYHPNEVTRERFLQQCQRLLDAGVPFSVGVVGLKEHADEIAALRAALPKSVYLWINAYKRTPDYTDSELLERFTAIDPLFPINTVRHRSQGHACRTGDSVISVDGDGTMRRCHFVREPIGNLYDADFADALRPRLCENATCGCHIGYVHLERLGLNRVFGSGVLERIPRGNVDGSEQFPGGHFDANLLSCPELSRNG
ncbi:STM4011 family radical SAM protein [Tuwongella immobilis]|uniref:STM4011 family radical SAM protein n=1 Tax=Tuwongella immobilis TaxID=692036 RepID=UPI001576C18F